jgi:chromosome segregation ATPase
VDHYSSPYVYLKLLQVLDIIERYTSREQRLQRVLQQDADMRDALIAQKRRKDDLSGQLAKTAAKLNTLASSRQVYQEVDMKDAALSSARKECNECRERESRLRQNIESISRSFPRFLTKVTKIVHPIPTLDQVLTFTFGITLKPRIIPSFNCSFRMLCTSLKTRYRS